MKSIDQCIDYNLAKGELWDCWPFRAKKEGEKEESTANSTLLFGINYNNNNNNNNGSHLPNSLKGRDPPKS